MTCPCCKPAEVTPVLLADISGVIRDSESFVATPDLIARLIDFNPSQWSSVNHFGRDLTAQRMGRILSRAGICSTKNHIGQRGYCTADLTLTEDRP